jgi:hypothetical protein
MRWEILHELTACCLDDGVQFVDLEEVSTKHFGLDGLPADDQAEYFVVGFHVSLELYFGE